MLNGFLRQYAMCDYTGMKPKTCDEGPTALRNFTRTMQALFRVPKSEVVEAKDKRKRKSPKTAN